MVLSAFVFYLTILLMVTVSEVFIFGLISIPIYLMIAYIMDETTQYLYNQQSSDEVYRCLSNAKNSRPKLSMTITKYIVNHVTHQGVQHQVYGNQIDQNVEFK